MDCLVIVRHYHDHEYYNNRGSMYRYVPVHLEQHDEAMGPHEQYVPGRLCMHLTTVLRGPVRGDDRHDGYLLCSCGWAESAVMHDHDGGPYNDHHDN